jgi:hypothetical protein
MAALSTGPLTGVEIPRLPSAPVFSRRFRRRKVQSIKLPVLNQLSLVCKYISCLVYHRNLLRNCSH